MKLTYHLLLIAVILFALPGCSNEDEPLDQRELSGEWYLTHIKGWKYEEEEHNHKSDFNITILYDECGDPIGDDVRDAQRVEVLLNFLPLEPGVYYRLDVFYSRWNPSRRTWYNSEILFMKLKGDQLIGEGNKILIIKQLTDSTLTTYQKDENGETYKTYTKL